jgi:hypothetical protein
VRSRRATLVASLALVIAVWLAPGSSTSAAPAAPAPLPASRLEFGLSNLDATWMTSSGVPWRYRYQYLAGGVNTSGNWLTWQDPALPPGQFALDFMNNSTTAPANYIPVFTYYELLQSNPSTGSSELDRDYSNLNNATTMSAYYANFKVLMQKAGAYGRQVVVHVEPDLWGYMQQKAAGGSAAAVAAKVKSSGFAEASGFADNFAGYAAELKYLRDAYAPNALLAMHASMWSSGIDIASNTDPNVNASGEADKTSAFLNSAGAGTWDVVFNDVDDHDASWWELASCATPPCVNQYFTHWWDPSNVRFPNFARYLGWVGELHSRTSKPQIAWQVPVGNQYFLTMNNTCGHYQDNVAAYFVAHAGDLYNAGLIAVLFGAGNHCQTSYDDQTAKDGITNGNSQPTSDALGGCSACNTHPSMWADDDGGYLRTFVGQYYSGLAACGSASLAALSPSPQVQGVGVQFSASANGCANPEYEFWLRSPAGVWTLQRGYGSGSTWSWDTRGYAAGTYVIHAWARRTGSAASWETFGEAIFTLTPAPACTSASLSPATVSQPAGSTVALTASTGGCPKPAYEYWVQYPAGAWYLKQGWSGSSSFAWDTSGLAPGQYVVHSWAARTAATWEVIGESKVTLTGCTSAAVAPASTSEGSGSVVSLSTTSGGCPNPVYEYWVQYPNGSWNLKRGWDPSGSFAWDTTGLAPGVYVVHAWANQQGAAPTLEVYGESKVTLTGCTGAGLSPASLSQAAGTAVVLSASASGCPKPQYEYWVQYPNGVWYLKQGWTSSSTFSWSTTGLAPGVYVVHSWVNAVGSGHDAIGESRVTLTGCTSATVSSTVSGSSVTFTAAAGGCPSPVYEFWLLDPAGVWHLEQGFGTQNTWTWSTTGWPKGTYTVHVWANNQGSDTSKYQTIGSGSYALS